MNKQSNKHRILRVDASARFDDSVSRQIADAFESRLKEQETPVEVRYHDVGAGIPLIDEDWVEGDNTDAEERTQAHKEALALSDGLIDDLQWSNLVLVSTPIYNFGMPAALKAWFDQVERAGETFEYTDDGPQGLLDCTRAVVTVASGGTELGSDIDFASEHIEFLLDFMGIDDIDFIAADAHIFDDNALESAKKQARSLAETVTPPTHRLEQPVEC